jgi:beta-1,4-mannosyltransferase
MGITVLESFPVPRPTTNPYIVMLGEALAATPGVRVLNFSYRTALLGRYHVFHVHWPEILVSGHSPLKKAVRQVLFALLLLRLWASRTPLVRTHHNLGIPAGISRREAALLRLAERLTTLWIVINPVTPGEGGRRTVQILHGHYRDWFAAHPPEQPVPGRLAYFGLVRPYKNVPELVRVFREIGGDEGAALSLSVAGKPDSEELAAEVAAAAAGDERVSLELRFLDDQEMVAAISRAELVVLPYREMHNSGAVLLALSLDRPVLVPRNEVNALLATEVGPAWVQTYTGDLTPAAITSTLARLRADPPVGRPDLSLREWADAGERHRTAFQQALGVRRPRD